MLRSVLVATICIGLDLPAEAQPPEFDQAMRALLGLSSSQREQLQAVDVPMAAERKYGQQVLETFERQLRTEQIRMVDRGREVKYLHQLADRVKPLMNRRQRYGQLQIMIVESPDIDARSVPGGRLLFFRGLLDFVTSEAALVGILGHELAHLDHGHQLKPLQHQQLAQQKLQQFGTGNPPHFSDMFDFAKMSAGSFHPIHPEEEKQADADATLWLYNLGYDPAELARLFNQLADRAGGQDRMVPSFLRTHPLMRDRARDVLQQLEKLQQARPIANLVVGQAALQTRTPAPLP